MSIDGLKSALADHYRLERELGQGGMATVYLAHDIKHDRRVAIKVLRPELAAVIGAERFLSEIKTTANLQHPHILALFDSGQADGTVFYVMPFVEGESLRDRLTREKQLPIDDALRIASEVADALQYAHSHGVIHRDIKPENILLHGGHALVADFGIALAAAKVGGTRMTETGMSLGTPTYMSPEQAMGERELDARTDVYALGCVAFEMFAGEPPFTGPTAQAIVAKVVTEPAPSVQARRASVPDHVDDAIRIALQKTPADRFNSAAEFAAALNEATRTSGRGLQRDTRRAARRSSPIAAAGIVAGVAVAAALAGAWFGVHRTAPDVGLQVARQLTFDGNVIAVAISPDGQSIAYATDDCLGQLNTCNVTVRVRDVDGTQSLAIVKSWRNIAELKWSPDGALLAIRGSPDTNDVAVYLTDKLGGSLRPIRVNATAMGFTADHRYITLATGGIRQSLQRYDVATLTRVDSVPLPPGWVARDLSYSPDGKRAIAMIRDAGDQYTLALFDPRGRILDSVIEPGAARDPLRLAPDGSAVYTFEFGPGIADNLVRIPVRSDRLDRTGHTIVLGQVNDGILGLFDVSITGRFAVIDAAVSWGIELHTGGPSEPWRSITRHTGWLAPWAISPDGHSVAAAATDNLGDNIAIFSLDSGPEVRAVTVSRSVHQNPEWSPDGKRLAFYSYQTTPQISVADVSGGAERHLAKFAPGFTWVSDDALLLLGANTIDIVDTSGKVRDSLAIPAQFAPDLRAWPVRDPSATRAAYASVAAHGFVVVDLNKKQFTALPMSEGQIAVTAWSGDGGALFVAGIDRTTGADGQRALRLYRMPTNGGVPTIALTMPPFCATVIVDTDARHVVCGVKRGSPDVWLADKTGRSGW